MLQTDFARGTTWGIVPEKFDEILRQAAALNSIKDDDAKKAFFFSVKSDPAPPPYTITNGVAVISISGPLMKRSSWFSRGKTYGDIQDAVRQAAADPDVVGIVLDMDSPGGTVNGVEETAAAVAAARSQKPVASVASGLMASAAYWVGSAADRVFVGRTADVGSIGVLMVHTDWSKFDERVGVKTTYLTAGKYKALGNDAEPLSEFARAEFQAQLDQIYGEFISAVAENRGRDEAYVRESMADGRIHIGERAVAVGLGDEIGSLQSAVDWVSDQAAKKSTTIWRNGKMKIENMEQLRAAAPDLIKKAEDDAFALGAESVDTKPAEKAATEAERVRVLALATAVFGEDQGKQLADIVGSGVTVEQYQAISKITGKPAPPAADPKKDAMLAAIQNAGAPDVGSDPAAGKTGGDYFSLVDSYRAEHKCTRTEAMRAINKSHPAARAAMLAKANPGNPKFTAAQ